MSAKPPEPVKWHIGTVLSPRFTMDMNGVRQLIVHYIKEVGLSDNIEPCDVQLDFERGRDGELALYVVVEGDFTLRAHPHMEKKT